jgi:Neurotransmitter-gated ion-channel ligand binding domain
MAESRTALAPDFFGASRSVKTFPAYRARPEKRRLLGLLALFFLLALASVARSAGPPLKSATSPTIYNTQNETTLIPPPGTDQPIDVKVGLYVINLVALDEVEQTFTCTAYLTESWNDPRLAFTFQPGQPAVRYYKRDDIWFPLLQFDNSTNPRELSGYLVTGRPDGTIHYIEKLSVRLSIDMYLRAFPFDAQDLEVYVHPFTGQAKRIRLSGDASSTGVSDESYTPLPLWNTGPITYRTIIGEQGAGDTVHSHVVFGIHVVRHSEYYVFRIFVPLVLMVAISWGVLWIPPTDLNSQLMISVTTVLTLVAFSVAVSNVLPPVPYLTFYDTFFLISFFFILLTIGEAIIVHTLHGTNRAKALKARYLSRRLLPPLFVLTCIAIAAIFFR